MIGAIFVMKIKPGHKEDLDEVLNEHGHWLQRCIPTIHHPGPSSG
jgi:hypothetical protein